MFDNILIVGCGLIGSSILRGSISKKISKNTYVFDKSKKNVSLIKKINKKIKFLDNINHTVSKMDLIVISTHMNQYDNILKRLLRYISSKTLITDTSSTKRNIEELINSNKKLKKIFVPCHPIAGSEVSGPEFGNKDLFKDKWCIILKNSNKPRKNLKKIETEERTKDHRTFTMQTYCFTDCWYFNNINGANVINFANEKYNQ